MNQSGYHVQTDTIFFNEHYSKPRETRNQQDRAVLSELRKDPS